MLAVDENLARFAKDKSLRSKGQALALDLDAAWGKALDAPTGPIDVIDMFSGCGGMSAGFLAVNALTPAYRLAMAVDIDVDANNSYEANLGLRPQRLDVAELGANPAKARKLIASVRSNPSAPLVMIGCAPCQGFSSHRNSHGEGDKRNSLFISFTKIAVAVKPDAVIIENVPELLTDRYWPLVDQARKMLSEAGYSVRVDVHNMAEFGVPQQRFRAVMIAMRKSFGMPKGFLSRGTYRTVRSAISYLPKITPGQIDPTDPMHYTAGHRPSTVETIKAVPRDGGNRPKNVGPSCLQRAEDKSGRAAYEDVYGRLWWDRPSITMTAYSRNPASGRFVHPDQHRGLSVREVALLQSFPRSYSFCGSLDSRFRQVGNAVPPAFSAFLATHLLGELLGSHQEEPWDEGITAPVGPSFSRLIPALKAGHRTISGSQRPLDANAHPC